MGQNALITTSAIELRSAIARYAERLHSTLGATHHVASPLGAWLLLALTATAAEDSAKPALAAVLGVDVDVATAFAAALLAAPHPLVGMGAAIWHRPEIETDLLKGWLRGLPPAVETGPIPTKVDSDAWVKRETLGLMGSLPIKLEPDHLLLLVSALATKVTWRWPFTIVAGDRLGPTSPWASQLQRALGVPEPGVARMFGVPDAHALAIGTTERAGDVAVHTVYADGGLQVTSVIADAEIPAIDVLAAAYEIATDPAFSHRSLFEMPLGEGPAWTITERRVEAPAGDRLERFIGVLPAWSAQSTSDLGASPDLGFGLTSAALARLLPKQELGYLHNITQTALARYTRVGFEAAAVTGHGLRTTVGIRPRHDAIERTAEIRFGHPFAVVAVASDVEHTEARKIWDQVPVFSAWVSVPEEAAD